MLGIAKKVITIGATKCHKAFSRLRSCKEPSTRSERHCARQVQDTKYAHFSMQAVLYYFKISQIMGPNNPFSATPYMLCINNFYTGSSSVIQHETYLIRGCSTKLIRNSIMKTPLSCAKSQFGQRIKHKSLIFLTAVQHRHAVI